MNPLPHAIAVVGCFAVLVHAGPAMAQVAAGTASSQVLVRVDPQVPGGIDVPANYEVSCKVLFDVDGQGLPASTHVTGCDEPFATAARTAAVQWRFRPAVVGGQAVPYKYSARLTFQRTTGQSSVSHILDTSTSTAAAASQIRVLHKVEPILQKDLALVAAADGSNEFRCKVRIDVGVDGVPVDAVVVEAPEYLAPSLREAALQWRFEPVVVAGQPQAFSYMWSLAWTTL